MPRQERKRKPLVCFRTVQIDALRKGFRILQLFSDHCRLVCDKDTLRITAENPSQSLKICWSLYGAVQESFGELTGSVESYTCFEPTCATLEFGVLSQMLASHITAIDVSVVPGRPNTCEKAGFVVCTLHSRSGPEQQQVVELPALNDEPEDLDSLGRLQTRRYTMDTWVAAYSLQYAVRFINCAGVKLVRLSVHGQDSVQKLQVAAILGDEDDYAEYCSTPVLSRAAIQMTCHHTPARTATSPHHSMGPEGRCEEEGIGTAGTAAHGESVYMDAADVYRLCKNISDIANHHVPGLGPSVLLNIQRGQPFRITTVIGVVGVMTVWIAEARRVRVDE